MGPIFNVLSYPPENKSPLKLTPFPSLASIGTFASFINKGKLCSYKLVESDINRSQCTSAIVTTFIPVQVLFPRSIPKRRYK